MGKEQTTSPLVLEGATATMRKISNNLLSFGDEKVTAFTLPFEGIGLAAEQLDAFMGKYTHRSWFETRPDSSVHPCSWFSTRKNADFPIDFEFDCEDVTIEVSGGKELEFESYEHADDKTKTPAARITHVVLEPKAGGMTMLSFHMQVRPGIGKTNLALQEHQTRQVKITLGNTTLAKARNSGQQSLPLESKPDEAPALDGSHIAARYADGTQGETSAPPQGDQETGGPEAQEAGSASIEAPIEPQAHSGQHQNGAEGEMDDPETDIKRFEEGARKAAAEFKNVSETGVIDGRSERVKHKDRQRSRKGLQ